MFSLTLSSLGHSYRKANHFIEAAKLLQKVCFSSLVMCLCEGQSLIKSIFPSFAQVAKEAIAQSLDPAKIKKIYILSALMVSQ